MTSGEHVPVPSTCPLQLLTSKCCWIAGKHNWKRLYYNHLFSPIKYSVAVEFIDFNAGGIKCEHAAGLTAPRKHSKHCVCREPNWPNDIYAAIKLALTVAMIHLRIWEFLPPTGATQGKKM